MSNHLMWAPTQQRIMQSILWRFMENLNFQTYAQLHHWSCEQKDLFWDKLWDFTHVIGEKAYPVSFSQNDDPLYAFENTRFFPNAKLNIAQNLLRKRDESIAITFCDEVALRRTLTFHDLYDQVSSFAQFLKENGVQKDDRVAGFIPNIPEAVIAFIATASIGAIWTACSPDFGVQSVLDRFAQTQPKILITSCDYQYAGKIFNLKDRVIDLKNKLDTIQKVVVVESTHQEKWDINYQTHDFVPYKDISLTFPPKEIEFVLFEFNIPILILYSSGTTGVPKCIVHGAGGTLLTHLKEHQLQSDIKPGDQVFYYTTCGWMMWNWQLSVLASGASIVLYDGSPLYPSPSILFDYIEKLGLTFFGVSAKYFSALEKSGFKPQYSLSTVKTIASTGSPLLPESYDYVYNILKKDVHLMSISGGTDIVSCFFIGNPIEPVFRGELQCAGLGYKMESYDDSVLDGNQGKALPFGMQGELVCTLPFPSQPLYFWNDRDPLTHQVCSPAVNYHNAYFKRFLNVWHHGDRLETTENGGYIIYGRSDAILNPGGVRIGTGEIYRQVEQIPYVLESLAVGLHYQDDIQILLFVILKENEDLTDDRVAHIKQHIRTQTTARHVPYKIFQVHDLPRTKNGKLAEIAARNVINGVENTNLSSLANPNSLDESRQWIPYFH